MDELDAVRNIEDGKATAANVTSKNSLEATVNYILEPDEDVEGIDSIQEDLLSEQKQKFVSRSISRLLWNSRS